MLSKRPSRRVVAEPLKLPAPSPPAPDERTSPPAFAPAHVPRADPPRTVARA
jgi:hypothetical protein